MTKAVRLLPNVMSCVLVALLSACGDGGNPNPGGSGSVTSYQVSATAGGGGTISPSSATVNAGGTTTFTVTPKIGYFVSGFTGCGADGSLVGTTFTTGTINAACTVTASFAAAFTWFGGSNAPGANGVYGTQGVAAATNVPRARDGGVTWTDSNGNLWLFGGFAGYVNGPIYGNFLNDLWKYSTSSGEWTWVSGSNTIGAQGVYGTQGIAAATNVPGARSNEISWTDANGSLWLFGGAGTDATGNFIVFNDLWKYSPASGEWTWVGGSNTPGAAGVYGTRGVAAATNMPGSREVNNVVWKDAAGNIWLFGGDGSDSTGAYTRMNDLWEYSPTSGEWTWVSGSPTGNAVSGPNAGTAIGVYGTRGVSAAANVPGARLIPVTWMDTNGNLWLFGGEGYDSTGSQGELNDLWEYSPSSGNWTWIGGSGTVSPTGVYGTEGVAAAANVPAGRDGAAAWTDASGNMWLFGGQGFNTPTGFYHRLNDLWKYSPSSGEWTWVAGSNTFDATGVYGAQGVAAATNVLGARAAPFRWQDASGNVWLFGGYQADDSTNTRFEMNDLWMYPATQ
jgi:N-acetylneuraminic acid mutarotase